MPDVDGFELADVIRQHPRFQKTAIIFISGVHLTDSDKIQGYRSGAVDYISVPVIPEVLRAKVSIFVELHRKTRMLERLNSELERRVEERTEELRRAKRAFAPARNFSNWHLRPSSCAILKARSSFWNAGAETLYGWSAKRSSVRTCTGCCELFFRSPREDVETALREQRETGKAISFSRPGVAAKLSSRAAKH